MSLQPGYFGKLPGAGDFVQRRLPPVFVDAWDRDWTTPSSYRGLNATMHAVEAMLAAADATGDQVWVERTARVCDWLVELAEAHDHRLPEHFDEQWRPLLDFNRDRPDDPFRPFGATVGHALEWSRLLLDLESVRPFPQALPTARALFERAVADGWSADGAPGFVYTTDWTGRPVVRERMHWVVAEAIGAASTLAALTGEASYDDWARLWWAHVEECFVDRERGSWHHQLDPTNRPVATVWPGKPDLYHAVQATLVGRLPVSASFGGAIRKLRGTRRSG